VRAGNKAGERINGIQYIGNDRRLPTKCAADRHRSARFPPEAGRRLQIVHCKLKLEMNNLQ
jgi:hypothetical protein